MAAHAERRREAPAIATPALRLTYGELADRVRDFTAHLVASGAGRGDRVLLALPNCPATVVASLAVHAMGGSTVEVNREWGAQTLGEIAARCRVRHAVIWGRDARTWGAAFAKAAVEFAWVVHPGLLPDRLVQDLGAVRSSLLLEEGRPDPSLGTPPPAPPCTALAPDSQAVILYTSGSTGRPRGVVQTFRNIDANTRSIVSYLELSPSDRAMLVLPLYYCYGRSVLQTHLFAGGSVYLDNRFAFPRVVLETLGSERCTGFAGVPLTFEIIRRQVDVSTLSFPALRYLTQAGGAMAPDTVAWVRTAFRPARLFIMYGQTEATSRLSYLPPECAEEKEGSIGTPIPGVELAVVDEAGASVPDGVTGHLVARGANVTLGYLDEPEETAAILRRGWLWTGDLARRDAEGFFFLQGRSKEILKIGGHRVSPIEIEHMIEAHPDVAEAAVVGTPDPLMGEVPTAFVVPQAGRSPSESDIKKFCRERMASYRVPAAVCFVEALPRNEAGKLLRAALATAASKRQGPRQR